MSALHQAPTDTELAGFRRIQRLAYECAETIAAGLKPGMTERQVARQMKDWLLDNGVTEWFHQPFAWFGDRTAFRGLIGVKQLGGFNPAFYPGFRRLEENKKHSDNHAMAFRCNDPDYLLIVPLLAQDEVLGIIELASFRPVQEFEIKFVERIAPQVSKKFRFIFSEIGGPEW